MTPAEQQPFFKSYMYSTNDAGAIPVALQRGFYVVVILDKEEMQFYPGCMCKSMLLPPPMLVLQLNSSELSDPNYPNIFRQYMIDYHNYLLSTAVEGHIANLLAAMYCTTHPTLLYTEFETDHQFHILESIHMLFEKAFGIRIGMFEEFITGVANPTRGAGFIMNPVTVSRVLDLLFKNGYVSELEFAKKYPVDMQGREIVPLSEGACSLLLAKYNCVFPDLRSSIIAAYNILHDYRNQAISGQICPVVKVKEQLDQARMQEINNIVSQVQNRFGRKNALMYQQQQQKPPQITG